MPMGASQARHACIGLEDCWLSHSRGLMVGLMPSMSTGDNGLLTPEGPAVPARALLPKW